MFRDSEIVAENLVPKDCIQRILRLAILFKRLVIQDPKIPGNYLVLEDCSGGDVDPVSMVCNDDHSTPQAHWVRGGIRFKMI